MVDQGYATTGHAGASGRRAVGNAGVSQIGVSLMKIMAALAAVALLAGWASARPSRRAGHSCPAAMAQATQAADMFLSAWTTCDYEVGSRLISDRLRQQVERDSTRGSTWILQYLSGPSNPHHVGFEITGGRLLGSDRAVFTVALIEHYTGEPEATRYDSRIELVREPRPGAARDSVLAKRFARMTEPAEWKVDVVPDAPGGR